MDQNHPGFARANKIERIDHRNAPKPLPPERSKTVPDHFERLRPEPVKPAAKPVIAKPAAAKPAAIKTSETPAT